jgi:hypothetical protein
MSHLSENPRLQLSGMGHLQHTRADLVLGNSKKGSL